MKVMIVLITTLLSLQANAANKIHPDQIEDQSFEVEAEEMDFMDAQAIEKASRKETAQMERESNSMTKKVASLKLQQQRAKEKTKLNEVKFRQAKTIHTQLSKEVRAEEQRANNLQTLTENSQGKLERLKTQMADLHSRRLTFQSQVRDLQKEKRDLEVQIQQAERKVREYQNQIQGLRTNVKKTGQVNNALKVKLGRIQRDQDRLNNRLASSN